MRKTVLNTIILIAITAALFILFLPSGDLVRNAKQEVPSEVKGIVTALEPKITSSSTIDVTPSPSPSTQPSITPTPTIISTQSTQKEQSGLQVQRVSPEPEKKTTTEAGAVTTLSLNNLQKGTLYEVKLPLDISASNLSISWPASSSIPLWTTTLPTSISQLAPLPHDDDMITVELTNHSGLLPFPVGKTLYLYPTQTIAKATISLIAPNAEVNSHKISTTGVYNSNSGASYTSLNIKTRDEWGANPATWDSNTSANIDDPSRLIWYPVYYKASRIVVHHTATGINTTNPAASVRAIYLYHAYTRKWGDIGYNFLIDHNGTIYEGKAGGDETQGYHAFGAANRMSVGISVIGDYSYSAPSSKARSSLVKLMAEKAAFYGFRLKYSDGGTAKWRDISYTVFGHRTSYQWDYDTNSWKVNQTACPGNAFAAILPSLTQEAENYRSTNYTSLKKLAQEVDAAFEEPHDQGTIIVRYNVPEDTTEEVMRTFVPAYSGIKSYTISGNTITYKIESGIVIHPYYGDSEYLVVPDNWTGYDGEYATFSIPYEMNGVKDRSKTLLKVFKLDSRVQAADLKHYLQVQEIEPLQNED
ncbi:MAG: peptidoglycan recognition family protein, partial [Patescibacteria group bacterium]